MQQQFSLLFLLIIFDTVASLAIGKKRPSIDGIEFDLLPTANVDNDACLMQVGQPRICDPEGILTRTELAQLNEELEELESATNVSFFPAPPMWDFLYKARCPQTGLTLSILLFNGQLSAPTKLTRNMATEFHAQWARAHPCAKNVLALVNLGAKRVDELFTAVATHNSDLTPKELAKYFYRESALLEKHRLGDVLSEMIEDIRKNLMLRM